MYNSYPTKTDVNIMSAGPNLEWSLIIQSRAVPKKCQEFLEKLGWLVSINHPDTGETLFQKPPPGNSSDEVKREWNYDLRTGYWHWYEAMSYEFGKFMGIDTDTGGGLGFAGSASGGREA